MFRVGVTAVFMAGAMGLVVSEARAQERLPLPPTPAPADYRAFDRLENFAEFLGAYKRSGSPRLGFTVDMVGRDRGAGAMLNDLGRLSGLGGRIEEYFRHPEVTIVNVAGMNALNAQQAEALRRNDEVAAARVLAEKSNVDVMVYVRLIEQVGRADGAAYSARYVVSDMRRGTMIGQHTWDMYTDARDGEFTAPVMGEYARAIARRVAAQYAEAFPEGGAVGGMRKFTLRLAGTYEDDDLVAFRDTLRAQPGVKSDSVILREEGVSGGRGLAEFEVLYGSDLLDLRRTARRAAVNALGMEAKVIDSREGQIDLKLAPLGMTTRERDLSGGDETPRNKEARSALARAYEKAGRPTIAVIINKAAVQVEESLVGEKLESNDIAATKEGDGTSVNTHIVLGDRVSIHGGVYRRDSFLEKVIDRELRDRRAERREDEVIDTRVFEDKILERFVQLGLTPKDVSAAQGEINRDPALQARTWNDRDLAFTLGQKAGADVVVSGVGRLVRDRATQKPVRVVFTMRAFQVKDGTIVAATTIQRELGEESLNQAVEELAAQAVGKLASQMGMGWEKGK
jgi:hypothetical protein